MFLVGVFSVGFWGFFFCFCCCCCCWFLVVFRFFFPELHYETCSSLKRKDWGRQISGRRRVRLLDPPGTTRGSSEDKVDTTE